MLLCKMPSSEICVEPGPVHEYVCQTQAGRLVPSLGKHSLSEQGYCSFRRVRAARGVQRNLSCSGACPLHTFALLGTWDSHLAVLQTACSRDPLRMLLLTVRPVLACTAFWKDADADPSIAMATTAICRDQSYSSSTNPNARILFICLSASLATPIIPSVSAHGSA
ncbi:hypothetical protein DNTS_031508 [Danionella cerebrum]|uniref:Uncharacterized protein n=1 Tax=Danionella cerebrum TaxID=2873325 RepID=A0A553QDX9_9TELE|nr:hypothetical protein DNTS_031508 [Danionella translucida]